MTNKTVLAVTGIAAGTLLVVVSIITAAIVFSGGDETPVAPVVTATTPAPSPTPAPTTNGDQFILGVLEDVWADTSAGDQKRLCSLYNLDPDMSWNSFDTGQNQYIDRATFDLFFGEKCATLY